MRVVLDTNVLIAAFIARGICSAVLEHCVRQHTLVTSDFILNQQFRKVDIVRPAEFAEYEAAKAGEAA